MTVPDPHEGRTLALLPIGLGNVLMALPALKAVSSALGPKRLDVLALKPVTAQLAEASGLVTRAFTWDPDREGLGRGWSVLRELRAERYEHSLAMFPTASFAANVYHRAVGAPDRSGFDYPRSSIPRLLQTTSLPLQDTHDVPQNVRLAEAFLGAHLPDAGAPFFPLPVEMPDGLPEGPFFACHPGSSVERGMGEKRLAPELFASLIRAVRQVTGWPCVLVGGPEEAALREQVAEGCRNALVPVATRSLSETAGVLAASRFLLCNDSGLMHLAAALGTRCAAYFGPTDEARTGPYGWWQRQGDAPRHLILRRPGTEPIWTLGTIGANPPLPAEGAAAWAPEPAWAAATLLSWVASFGETNAGADDPRAGRTL